ncbi:MAG: low molecular weight protein-tyrosine-phosphatase [Pseudomonadota bacterium]
MNHSILFVCLGNICRSPMAEGAMRAAGEDRGAALVVDSAGTGSWHIGDPPDRRAQAAAMANGVDISGQRARQIVAADFDRFDRIVAMDRSVFADVQALRPKAARGAISLLLDHVPGREGQDVVDPYYGGENGFLEVWSDVAEGAEALLAKIARA